MTDKEMLMKRHAEWGFDMQPINAQIAIDCGNAIQGLEEAVHNLGVIALMPDCNETKQALCKELMIISNNAAQMLRRYWPDVSADFADMPF